MDDDDVALAVWSASRLKKPFMVSLSLSLSLSLSHYTLFLSLPFLSERVPWHIVIFILKLIYNVK